MQETSFPNVDFEPALKDHFAALISENVDRLLRDTEALVKSSLAQAGQKRLYKAGRSIAHFFAAPRFALRSATACLCGFGLV